MRHTAKFACILCALFAFLATSPTAPSFAISPEEQLSDPVLEERARGLSKQLRCLVCQNQSIDDSDAELARDLRLEVRSLIVDGKSDKVILDDLRLRYGDYVLLNPPVSQATYLLWLSPIFIVMMGIGLFWIYRRSAASSMTLAEQVQPREEHNLVPSSSSSTLVISIGLGVLILIVATGLYSQFGRPDLPAQPLAQRSSEIAAAQAASTERQAQIKEAFEVAEQAAIDNPDDIDSWLNLAMRAAQAENSDIEIDALERAIELTGGNNAVKSMLAEALARQADGLVILPARALIEEVLAENPNEPRALYLFGLAAFQDEDYQLAVSRWQRLRQISAPDAPWLALVAENIAQAAQAGGFTPPEQAENAASSSAPVLSATQIEQMQMLNPEEQQEMIASMVDRLESKLAENPADLQGWQRLFIAREQLEDIDGMMRALLGAANADSSNPSAYLAILEFTLTQGQSTTYLSEAQSALEKLKALRPEGLEILFFTGHFAQLSGETAKAIENWQKLADQLEEASPLRLQLNAQIKALKNAAQ